MIDQTRLFLLRHLFHPLQGMTFTTWIRLLRQNRFQIDPPYWPRAALLTTTSLWNSCCRSVEDAIHGRFVRGCHTEAPLFVLGHYRSGTTHLHNLLSIDPQFASPNFFQAFFPHSFLLTERTLAPFAALFLSRRRLQDGVARSVTTPAEDENALCAATLLSPYLNEAFRRLGRDYDRYLSFHDVPHEEINEFNAFYVYYLQKLSYHYNMRLLLKSPPHTARIGILLDLFPEAQFVHIYRNPYDVFRSTVHMMDAVAATWHLQRPATRDNTDYIINHYKLMFDSFFHWRPIIPQGRFHELRFEDLVRDPIGEVSTLYSKLGLAGFEEIRVNLSDYVEATSGHRRTVYPEIPGPLRSRLSREWGRCFEEWGYPI